MSKNCLLCLVFVLVSLTMQCQGSKILFTATPTEVIEGQTPQLTINCALKDDVWSRNVQLVTSITITKVEGTIQRTVAKIVSGQAAQAGARAMGASVSGSLVNRESYLQATWPQPRLIHAGSYRCEIVALETDGSNTKFKFSLSVQADLGNNLSPHTGHLDALNEIIDALKARVDNAATLDQVESLKAANVAVKNDIESLKAASAGTESEIASLKSGIAAAQDEISSLKSEIATAKNDIASLKSEMWEAQNKIRPLNSRMNDLIISMKGLTPHNEEGVVFCDKSGGWGPDFTTREYFVDVRFSKPYRTLPLINISPVQLDTEHTRNTIYFIQIRDLTTSGFRLICGTYHNSLIYFLHVRWTSSI